MQERQEVASLKQDEKAQQDSLTQLYGVSKMYMDYLMNDQDPEQLENKRFVRTWMFDSLIKSYMVLYEETLKSKELLNYLKVSRLQDQLA